MARRVPEQNQDPNAQTQEPSAPPEAQPTADGIPGGAPGVILDASSTIINPEVASSHAEVPADAPEVEVKRYRVMNDPPAGKTGFPVLLDGCLSQLPKGKVVSEANYDIAKLESQGVILQPL